MQGMVSPPGESHSGDKALPLEGIWEEVKENTWKDSLLALQDWDLEGRSKVREETDRSIELILRWSNVAILQMSKLGLREMKSTA